MTDPDKSQWFRQTSSGQVFEAEGEQARIASKDRDVVRLEGPPDNDGDTHPVLTGLRERLDVMEVPWSDNATEAELAALIETQATAWRAELDKLGVKNTASWKPETLKRKLAEAQAGKPSES